MHDPRGLPPSGNAEKMTSVELEEPLKPAARQNVFVKSYGCQMNAHDAARMADVLAPEGYSETAAIEDADLIILNTCHIRERATEKVFSELGKMKALKRERAARGLATTIAVAGCVAQAEGAEIFRRQKAVDLVVGPQSYHRLPELLNRARRAPGVIDTDFPPEDKFDHLTPPSAARIRARGISAFVTIQEGCDKFCTFCVVPYTRGAEFSRPAAKIISEVRRLAENGVREVTLLGQNVNAYHGVDETGRVVGLAALLERLADVEGVARLRYTTSHPCDMSDDLIAAHKNIPQLMPFLHLPVQSGSDRVLAAMNRRHDAADYLDAVARIRAARSDIALSSDFIVGFPGETEAEFLSTLDLVRQVGFASTFFFKYSARPGTPGADLPDHVPEAVKSDRLARLQELVEAQRQGFNRAMVGRVTEVLLERPGRHPGQLVGKSPYMQQVQVDAPPSRIGAVVAAQIVDVSTNSLFGRLLSSSPNPALQEVPV